MHRYSRLSDGRAFPSRSLGSGHMSEGTVWARWKPSRCADSLHVMVM